MYQVIAEETGLYLHFAVLAVGFQNIEGNLLNCVIIMQHKRNQSDCSFRTNGTKAARSLSHWKTHG